jgi:hypothetical protein
LRCGQSQVDCERREARLLDSKTGRKTIHLPLPALEILADLPRLDSNPYVIPGNKPGSHFIGVQRPWQRIRTAAGLEGLRIHDLRHAFASVAASSDLALPIIGKLLGHTQAATTPRYAHLAADPVKAAAQDVASPIAAAMKSGGKRNAVIPFPGQPTITNTPYRSANRDDKFVPDLVCLLELRRKSVRWSDLTASFPFFARIKEN